MAKISGFELRAIKKTIGMEGEGFTANVYLDNKKIGTCADYADGGLLNTCIEWDENIKKRLEKSFQKHTRVDTFELYKKHITIEEYLKLKEKNELPICKYDNKYEMMEDICNNLYFLEMLESDYKNALKKGYSGIVYASFVNLYHVPCPVDLVYQTDGSKDAFEKLKTVAEEASRAVNLYQFNSLNDFIIE